MVALPRSILIARDIQLELSEPGPSGAAAQILVKKDVGARDAGPAGADASEYPVILGLVVIVQFGVAP